MNKELHCLTAAFIIGTTSRPISLMPEDLNLFNRIDVDNVFFYPERINIETCIPIYVEYVIYSTWGRLCLTDGRCSGDLCDDKIKVQGNEHM